MAFYITTLKGLIVGSSLDSNEYPGGIKISDSEMSMINIETEEFHG